MGRPGDPRRSLRKRKTGGAPAVFCSPRAARPSASRQPRARHGRRRPSNRGARHGRRRAGLAFLSRPGPRLKARGPSDIMRIYHPVSVRFPAPGMGRPCFCQEALCPLRKKSCTVLPPATAMTRHMCSGIRPRRLRSISGSSCRRGAFPAHSSFARCASSAHTDTSCSTEPAA